MVKKIYTYYTIMLSLSFLVFTLLLIQLNFELSDTTYSTIKLIINAIWLIFVIDFLFRLYKANCKKTFFKQNKLDLLSIIPLDTALVSLRLLKAVKFAKVLKTSLYYFKIKKKAKKAQKYR